MCVIRDSCNSSFRRSLTHYRTIPQVARATFFCYNAEIAESMFELYGEKARCPIVDSHFGLALNGHSSAAVFEQNEDSAANESPASRRVAVLSAGWSRGARSLRG